MENKSTLDHLLKIEADAAALVNDAQAEADRRIHDSETKNRAEYEERFMAESQKREAALKEENERLKAKYKDELENYWKELSGIKTDVARFTGLFNEYLSPGRMMDAQ